MDRKGSQKLGLNHEKHRSIWLGYGWYERLVTFWTWTPSILWAGTNMGKPHDMNLFLVSPPYDFGTALTWPVLKALVYVGRRPSFPAPERGQAWKTPAQYGLYKPQNCNFHQEDEDEPRYIMGFWCFGEAWDWFWVVIFGNRLLFARRISQFVLGIFLHGLIFTNSYFWRPWGFKTAVSNPFPEIRYLEVQFLICWFWEILGPVLLVFDREVRYKLHVHWTPCFSIKCQSFL